MDIKFFDFINKNLSNSFFDIIMPFLSYIGWGGIIWIIISFYLIFIIKKEGGKLGLLCLIGLILSAILSEIILKNIFCKLRPYDIFKDVHLLVPKEKSFSFPSGHATSSFTSVVILGSKNKRKLLFFSNFSPFYFLLKNILWCSLSYRCFGWCLNWIIFGKFSCFY